MPDAVEGRMGEANGDVDEPAASTQVLSSGEGSGDAADMGLSVAARMEPEE